jgi:anti-sigma factor ChrR (cupin superfamily)
LDTEGESFIIEIVKVELQENAALHALGIADSEERAALLGSPQDPELAAELESLEQVAGQMSSVVAVEPPPQVKERLMAKINASVAANRNDRAPIQEGVLAIVRAGDGQWIQTPFAGITMKPLFYDPASGNQSVLVRMAPGAVYPCHHHKGLEHSLVLEGDAIFSDHTLHAGDYEVGASDHDHSSITTQSGCLVFIMRNRADIIYPFDQPSASSGGSR